MTTTLTTAVERSTQRQQNPAQQNINENHDEDKVEEQDMEDEEKNATKKVLRQRTCAAVTTAKTTTTTTKQVSEIQLEGGNEHDDNDARVRKYSGVDDKQFRASISHYTTEALMGYNNKFFLYIYFRGMQVYIDIFFLYQKVASKVKCPFTVN